MSREAMGWRRALAPMLLPILAGCASSGAMQDGYVHRSPHERVLVGAHEYAFQSTERGQFGLGLTRVCERREATVDKVNKTYLGRIPPRTTFVDERCDGEWRVRSTEFTSTRPFMSPYAGAMHEDMLYLLSVRFEEPASIR